MRKRIRHFFPKACWIEGKESDPALKQWVKIERVAYCQPPEKRW